MLNFDGQIKPYNPFFEGFSHENPLKLVYK